MQKRLCTTFAALFMAALSSTALAADKLHLERLNLKEAPQLKMYLTLLDGDGRVITGRAKEDVKLVLDSAEQGPATVLQTFADTKDPINLVVVAQLSPSMKDVIEDEKRGISLLADSLPPKSKMALLGYAGDTKRLSEMGAPADAQSASRTMVIDEETVEPRLLDVVRIAMDQLKAVPKGERKLIVIFADGIDIDMDAHTFASLGKRALEDEVVIDTIGYNSFDASKLRNLTQLSKLSQGNDRSLKSPGEISSSFNNIIDEIKGQYVATFELPLAGGDPKEHSFQAIISGGREAFSQQIMAKVPKAKRPPVTASSGTRWWLWILIFFISAGVLGLLAWLIFREKPEQPAEEPQAAAPAPAPAAQPQGPMKTMALDIGASGGSPMVGWMVGTTGKYADQTFKLKGGRTVIGTGAECDIKVEDQFMSSKHCEVRFEGGGYKLVDLGSTNGIVVNDKKVREHDLVDNDLIRFGRTEFKFKSVS